MITGTLFKSETFLRRALYRYEKYWLPLCLSKKYKDNKLYPPLDVAWIWSCHMLSPSDYIDDCMKNFGKVIGHSYLRTEEKLKAQEKTKKIWEATFDSSFDYLAEHRSSVGNENDFESFTSKMGYDILASANRQNNFYHQVALPHYEDHKYLSICLESYKKFLYLKKENPSLFITPTYGIDLIWHTHQVNPQSSDFTSLRKFK